MASSNRHWPSMFKTKSHPQWSHDISISSNCYRTQYSPERTPEPKPRWNPRPEQVRILEAIFNSGTVNPPRDEIRKIRAQLQEYGQVGDANVFYWFQNRKSRSKHKQRQQQQNAATAAVKSPSPQTTKPLPATTPLCDKSSNILQANCPDPQPNPPPPPTKPPEFLTEPTFLFESKSTPANGFCSYNRTCPGLFLSEMMVMSQCHCHSSPQTPPGAILPPPPPPISHQTLIPGGDEVGPTKSTVFIDDVCFDIISVPFNVREAFGDDAVLIQSTGQTVLTDEWGVTLQPLQHGGVYYLLRPFRAATTVAGLPDF